jgi:hypothetical protein
LNRRGFPNRLGSDSCFWPAKGAGAAAQRFGVSASGAIRWRAQERREGDIRPKLQGGDRHSQRIEAHAELILSAVAARSDITLAELREQLRAATRRAFKLRAKLSADGGIGDYILKPKWMRWRTYERATARIDKAEEAVEAHTAFLLDRLKQTGLDI